MSKGQFMRAIRFKAFGDPSVLELAEVADPAVRETTALVRVMAASINPETCGLGEARDAYPKVGSGTAGRFVLRPQE
jgi:NADPH:quinone reductase-like Zn-dependent oxidoreductase